jgi:protein arginine N-methyltransferase 3
LVNYIRAAVKEGNTKPDVSSIDLYADDKYLQPVLEDDALLFSLDDLASNDEVEGQSTVATEQSPEARIADLEAQLSTLSTHFDDFRAQVDQTLERRWTETAGGATIAESSADAKDWNPDPSYFEGYSYNGTWSEYPLSLHRLMFTT